MEMSHLNTSTCFSGQEKHLVRWRKAASDSPNTRVCSDSLCCPGGSVVPIGDLNCGAIHFLDE